MENTALDFEGEIKFLDELSAKKAAMLKAEEEQTAEEAFGELEEPMKADISRFDYEPKIDTVTISPNEEANKAIDEVARMFAEDALVTALKLSVNDPEQFKENVRANGQAMIDACVEATKDVLATEPLVGEPELGKLYAYPPEPNVETANKVMEMIAGTEWNPPRLSPVATLDAIDVVVDEAELSEAVCACDTCLEEAEPFEFDPDPEFEVEDADGLRLALEIVEELKTRIASLESKVEDLESRLTAHNIRASHKI